MSWDSCSKSLLCRVGVDQQISRARFGPKPRVRREEGRSGFVLLWRLVMASTRSKSTPPHRLSDFGSAMSSWQLTLTLPTPSFISTNTRQRYLNLTRSLIRQCCLGESPFVRMVVWEEFIVPLAHTSYRAPPPRHIKPGSATIPQVDFELSLHPTHQLTRAGSIK